MARVNLTQANELQTSYESSWFKIDDGDVVQAQFFGNSADDLDLFAVHRIDTGNNKFRYVNCLKDYDNPSSCCPFCENGYKVEIQMVLCLVNIETRQTLLWTRGKGRAGATMNQMQSMFSKYAPISNRVFDIERFGSGLDTTYQIIPNVEENVQPLDLTQFKKPNPASIFIDLTDTQMQQFISTGVLPTNNNQSNNQQQTNNAPVRSRRG